MFTSLPPSSADGRPLILTRRENDLVLLGGRPPEASKRASRSRLWTGHNDEVSRCM